MNKMKFKPNITPKKTKLRKCLCFEFFMRMNTRVQALANWITIELDRIALDEAT